MKDKFKDIKGLDKAYMSLANHYEEHKENAIRQVKDGAFVDLLNQEMEELQNSMKDKEKQIEEMAKDLNEVETDVGHILLNETFSYVKEYKKYNSKKDFSNAHTKTFEERTAEEMFKKGYRKLPENARVILDTEDQQLVVLSREEYNDLIKSKRQLGCYIEDQKILLQRLNLPDPFWFCVFGGCEGVCKECKDTCKMSIFVKERKKTTEKILNELVGHTFEDNGWTWTVSKKDIQWLADKYKVKIKED